MCRLRDLLIQMALPCMLFHLLSCTGGVDKETSEFYRYPAAPVKTNPDVAALRLPPDVMPVIGCWFWINKVLQPEDFEPYLDKLELHSPYNLLTTSFRIPEREITEDDFHQQIKDAAIKILSTRQFNDISTVTGKNALKDEIMVAFNQIVKDKLITNIYFTEFVVQ